MKGANISVYSPANLNELWTIWGKAESTAAYADGAIALAQNSEGGAIAKEMILPSEIIVMDEIDELTKISRTERYLEIGGAVSIRDILKLEKTVPKVLREVLSTRFSPFLSPLITIGAAITRNVSEVTSVLTVLDTRYELRESPTSGRWIPAVRYHSENDDNDSGGAENGEAAKPRELITRIRVPLEDWSYAATKIIPAEDAKDDGDKFCTIILLAQVQKNMLDDLRMVVSWNGILRERSAETSVSGKYLPLSNRDIENFYEHWEGHLDKMRRPEENIDGKKELTVMEREILLNCIRSMIEKFGDRT
jgi:CO/xanthine dehydrogenase FAD-binding subunit